MADIKKGANEPFLYDDANDRITGLKNSDSSEKKFVYTDGSSGAISGAVTITNTTESTSATTGALIVDGGVGIAKRLNVTGAIQSDGGAIIRPNTSAPTSNVVLGPSAGAAMESGATNNICIGSGAGDQISTGDNNIAIGSNALGANSTTSNSIAVGNNALLRSTAADLVAIGADALDINTVGTRNIAIGRNSLGAATTLLNTGLSSGTITQAGSGGTDGTYTAQALTYVSGATFVSAPTATITVSGGAVTAVNITGRGSGFSGTSGTVFSVSNPNIPAAFTFAGTAFASAESNVAIGHSAGLALNSAKGCVLIGDRAGDAITSGDGTTAVGQDAAGGTTSGIFNTAIGFNALILNQTGDQNVAIGWDAARMQTASNMIAVGNYAMRNVVGNGNTAIGHLAGYFAGSGSTIATAATDSIFIGYQSRPNGSSQTNQVVIGGVDALGDGSNTTVIGNSSTTSSRFAGTATSRFEISGDTMRITGTRTPASNAAGTAGDFAFGTDGGTTYLYYCIASGNWGRVALTTGY